MKYKPCCERRCGVGGCKIQEQGGCYCLCRLVDYEKTLVSLLDGSSFLYKEAIIYQPGRTPIPLVGEEKEKMESQLNEVRLKIKKYEI